MKYTIKEARERFNNRMIYQEKKYQKYLKRIGKLIIRYATQGKEEVELEDYYIEEVFKDVGGMDRMAKDLTDAGYTVRKQVSKYQHTLGSIGVSGQKTPAKVNHDIIVSGWAIKEDPSGKES